MRQVLFVAGRMIYFKSRFNFLSAPAENLHRQAFTKRVLNKR